MTIYITGDGQAMGSLELHSGHYGDWLITITATGITPNVVDWQFTGLMHCKNKTRGTARYLGLIWDESRTLTDVEGYPLTRDELEALQVAGFNLYNFGPAAGYSASKEGAFLESVDELEAAEDFDAVGFIMAYEGGELGEDEVTEGFQHMLDTGVVWQLQGSYQRAATAMLDAGLIHHTRTRWGD